MEVRSSYCKNDFEWDQCQKVAIRDLEDSNLRLMRKHMAEVYENSGPATSDAPQRDPDGEDGNPDSGDP